jgi:ribosomal protein S18 acetylase RimI-like enzyme
VLDYFKQYISLLSTRSPSKIKTLTPSIRTATIYDGNIIAELSHRTFYDAFGSFNTKENMEKFMQNEFNKERLIGQISEPKNIFLLAYEKDEPVGYARMLESPSPPELGEVDAIEISRIYVEQKTIAKGIGSLLLRKCIDMAREKNKNMIWLGVWEHNTKAISFYRKFGFEKFGDQIFMLGDDPQTDLLMKKEL